MTDRPGQAHDPIGVLICDDHRGIREALGEIIGSDPDFRVVGFAVDGDDAVRTAKRLQPQLILLDLAMPHRTGLDALPELGSVAPEAKTVVLSAFAAPSLIEEAMRLGAVRFLEKGISVKELLAALRSVVGVAGRTDELAL